METGTNAVGKKSVAELNRAVYYPDLSIQQIGDAVQENFFEAAFQTEVLKLSF
ncbi:hypothetical protein [Rhizobium ruizarguesonis]|uniref:hypothetical protein n=1 Tax=Rhizobium ruizarguesonis TaxID=2081791 RepID=UPI0013D88AAC|nr:hypothetical protein [Rhizobium ruizarguesonis]